MIFDEYKTKPTAAPAATATSEKVTTDETETQYGTNNKYDDAARKKRVAYDGAENARPVSGAPTTLAKNYSHMAMEVSRIAVGLLYLPFRIFQIHFICIYIAT